MSSFPACPGATEPAGVPGEACKLPCVDESFRGALLIIQFTLVGCVPYCAGCMAFDLVILGVEVIFF